MNQIDRFIDAVGKVDDRFLSEVLEYESKKKSKKSIGRAGMVAAGICVMAGMGIYFYMDKKSSATIFAAGTNQRTGNAKVEISLGTITEEGSMKGAALGFYVLGKEIESITFSCENQWLECFDMRDPWGKFSGLSKNFTVSYGEREEEYYNILVHWVPNEIQKKLSEYEDIGISDLTTEEKSDVIELEITYLDGKQEIKQIEVSLNEDGLFTAYVNTEDSRKKILNLNKKPVESTAVEDMEEKYGETTNVGEENNVTEERSNVSLSQEEYEWVMTAVEDYYVSTVFEITDIKYWEGEIPYRREYEGYSEEEIVYFEVSVNNCNPNRLIVVGSKDGWRNCEILNEGY